MEPSSPWLDIHRASGQQRTADESPSTECDSDEKASDKAVTADGETEARTNPWDGVESARRPSQTNVALPSPDQPADD